MDHRLFHPFLPVETVWVLFPSRHPISKLNRYPRSRTWIIYLCYEPFSIIQSDTAVMTYGAAVAAARRAAVAGTGRSAAAVAHGE